MNLDDPYALSIINAIAPSVDIYTYSLKNSAATVYAESLSLTRQGFEARLVTPIGAGTVKGKLFGYFNVSNLLAVITTLINYLPKKKLSILRSFANSYLG